jgi:hypothetical protein
MQTLTPFHWDQNWKNDGFFHPSSLPFFLKKKKKKKKFRLQQQHLASSTALAVYFIVLFVFLPDLLALSVSTRVLRLAFSKSDLRFHCKFKSYTCHYTFFLSINESCRQHTFSLRLAHDGCGSNTPELGSRESHALLCEHTVAICGFLFFVYLCCSIFQVEDG